MTIQDTTHCEDLHHYAPRNILFTACEDSDTIRFSWFPPLGVFDDPTLATKARGSIHVIDPETMKSRRLAFENFDGPFVSHGIDVIADPDPPSAEAVYIFAVNHLPNTEYLERKQGPKARSQIEIFHHVIGTNSIRHIRSIRHPLIRTPNDIFANNPMSFYVTNDHHYLGGVMRSIEDVYVGATWTNTVHVEVLDLSTPGGAASDAINVTVALDKMHNNNGLGHGRSAQEILVTDCCGGTLHIGELSADRNDKKIRLLDSIQFDSVIDNPSTFTDIFPSSSYDASGFVLPGMARAIDIPLTSRDPEGNDGVMVWYVRASRQGTRPGSSQAGAWEKRLLFEDNGSRIRSASGAVLVAINPKLEGGTRKAWLFVTGFLSKNVVAIKVEV